MELLEDSEIEIKDGRFERKALIFAVPRDFAIMRVGSTEAPNNMYRGEFKRFVPGFDGAQAKRGIPLELERKIPAFSKKLATNIDSPNWESTLNNFWMDYVAQIPFAELITGKGSKTNIKIEGEKIINASYTVKNGIIYPDNIDEYILYQLMQNDDMVGTSADDYPFHGNFDFFCVNLHEEEVRKEKLLGNKMKVYFELAALMADKENTEKLKLIVSVTSEEVSAVYATQLTREQAIEQIMLLSEEKPDVFLKVLTDKNLAEKAVIKQLHSANVISKVQEAYFFQDTLLGSDLTATVRFFKSPESEGLLNRMKAKLAIYQNTNIS